MTHHSPERNGDAMTPRRVYLDPAGPGSVSDSTGAIPTVELDATPKRYGLSLGFRDTHGITSGRTFATIEDAARLICDVFEEAERLPDGVTWQILPDNDVFYAHVFVVKL